MALEAQNNPFTSVLMVEAADPEALPDADPSAGQQRLAVGTDHLLYLVNSSGVKTLVGGASGAMATDALWDAAGDLAQGTGANTGAKLTAGTAGYVLTSNGAAAAVSWQAPASSGAMVLLEQHSASSSATLDFTTFISSTYDTYVVHGVALRPATAGTQLMCRLGTGGGPTWDSSAAHYGHRGGGGNSTTVHLPYDSATGFLITGNVDNNASYGVCQFMFNFKSPQDTSKTISIDGTAQYHDGTQSTAVMHGGSGPGGAAITGLRFLFSSGNIASGIIRAYGIAK
jgi:hypothetical protein